MVQFGRQTISGLRTSTRLHDLYLYVLWVLSANEWVQWSSQKSIGLVTKRLRVRLTPGPLQATVSKLLTYCVFRPTQPPTLSRTANEQQLRLRGEGLVWLLGGDGVCASWQLHRGSNCPLARAVVGHIMRCGTIGSCQSAATSEIVKRCWSRV